MTDYLLSMYYPQVQNAVPDNIEEIMARVGALTDRMRTEKALVWTGGLEFANCRARGQRGRAAARHRRPLSRDQRGHGRLLDHSRGHARRRAGLGGRRERGHGVAYRGARLPDVRRDVRPPEDRLTFLARPCSRG